MLKIKLLPRGKKHQITYRIVASEGRSKYNGNFSEDFGFYIPQTKELKIDQEKLTSSLKNGAQLTTGVDKLLHPDKYPKKIKKKPAEKTAEVQPVPTATPQTK